MNAVTTIVTKIAHGLHIYPHDGKEVIYIRNGELHRRWVLESATLTGHEPLANIDGVTRMNIRNEVAEALGVRPAQVQRSLFKGEKLVYRSRQELK